MGFSPGLMIDISEYIRVQQGHGLAVIEVQSRQVTAKPVRLCPPPVSPNLYLQGKSPLPPASSPLQSLVPPLTGTRVVPLMHAATLGTAWAILCSNNHSNNTNVSKTAQVPATKSKCWSHKQETRTKTWERQQSD